MANLGRRMTVIENNTEVKLEIIVRLYPTLRNLKNISIASNGSTQVAATSFRYDASNPDRPPMIFVYIDGTLSTVTLTCQHFITYGKIIFARNSEGRLIVSGIKARWTDLGRIKGFGHIVGRSYLDREPEIIE